MDTTTPRHEETPTTDRPQLHAVYVSQVNQAIADGRVASAQELADDYALELRRAG